MRRSYTGSFGPALSRSGVCRHRFPATVYNLGIFRIASDKSEASKDQIKRVTADLYCERMELQFPTARVAHHVKVRAGVL